eukprot:3942628-Prymnesium_polylepis.1
MQLAAARDQTHGAGERARCAEAGDVHLVAALRRCAVCRVQRTSGATVSECASVRGAWGWVC